MGKREIIDYLKNFVSVLEINGENEFKLRAYRNAIRKFEGMDEKALIETIKEKRLEEIKGIGKKISYNVYEFFEEGRIREFEDLKREIPDGVLMMLKIPGLGPKKVKRIFEELKIKNLKDLKNAVESGNIFKIKGFGEKMRDKILKGIEFLSKSEGFFRFDSGYQKASQVIKYIKGFSYVNEISFCGKLRRFENVLNSIDIIVVTDEVDKLIGELKGSGEVLKILERGKNYFSLLLSDGKVLKVWTSSSETFPLMLQKYTGSEKHNKKLLEIAKSKNFSLKEKGLFNSDGKRVEIKDEYDIYKNLGFKEFIPPEIREDMGEIERSIEGNLPELIKFNHIKGVLHLHTTYSDGKNSLLEMAEGCRKLGYKYMLVTDHSKSAFYANGLSEDRIFRQFEEIEKLNEMFEDFKILKGIEVDILKDGSLDYKDEILSKFDIVIASIHSSFTLKREEMTERIVKAISNKYVDILGHPTGRLLLRREGYEIDMDRIFRVAKMEKKAIEINANPHRLDLDWKNVKKAVEMGIKVSINPDAHNLEGLNDIFYGVLVARKGWCKKEDVLNTMDALELLEWKKSRF